MEEGVLDDSKIINELDKILEKTPKTQKVVSFKKTTSKHIFLMGESVTPHKSAGINSVPHPPTMRALSLVHGSLGTE